MDKKREENVKEKKETENKEIKSKEVSRKLNGTKVIREQGERRKMYNFQTKIQTLAYPQYIPQVLEGFLQIFNASKEPFLGDLDKTGSMSGQVGFIYIEFIRCKECLFNFCNSSILGHSVSGNGLRRGVLNI
jgi:hypothetical protein